MDVDWLKIKCCWNQKSSLEFILEKTEQKNWLINLSVLAFCFWIQRMFLARFYDIKIVLQITKDCVESFRLRSKLFYNFGLDLWSLLCFCLNFSKKNPLRVIKLIKKKLWQHMNKVFSLNERIHRLLWFNNKKPHFFSRIKPTKKKKLNYWII